MKALLVAALSSAAFGQQIERPRMLSANGYSQLAALGTVAAMDYHSTDRATRNLPWAIGEGNPLIACPGWQRCAGRHAAMDIGLGFAVVAIDRYLAPKLPPRARKAMQAMGWAGIGFRSVMVVRNYRIGGAR